MGNTWWMLITGDEPMEMNTRALCAPLCRCLFHPYLPRGLNVSGKLSIVDIPVEMPVLFLALDYQMGMSFFGSYSRASRCSLFQIVVHPSCLYSESGDPRRDIRKIPRNCMHHLASGCTSSSSAASLFYYPILDKKQVPIYSILKPSKGNPRSLLVTRGVMSNCRTRRLLNRCSLLITDMHILAYPVVLNCRPFDAIQAYWASSLSCYQILSTEMLINSGGSWLGLLYTVSFSGEHDAFST